MLFGLNVMETFSYLSTKVCDTASYLKEAIVNTCISTVKNINICSIAAKSFYNALSPVTCTQVCTQTCTQVYEYLRANMCSLKSVKRFATTNAFLISVATAQYFAIGDNFSPLAVICTYIARNYLLMSIIDYNITDKQNLCADRRTVPKEKYRGEFHVNLIVTTVIEALTVITCRHVFNLIHPDSSYAYDLISFIPVSFVFELVFDFIHYWSHRALHQIPWLYINFHKKHHKFNYPNTIVTFYQDPIDLMLTNSLPTTFGLMCVKTLFGGVSDFQFSLLIIYKSYIEICGHSGKDIKRTSAFVQFMWLPKMLGIELITEDHDIHHTKNNCNYSKRFSLYDKLFGTYK